MGTNWEFTSEATKGSKENIRRLDSGELDIALSNAAITYFANRGEANWEKAYEIRALATLAPNVAMFVTHANSGILEIDDLRGRRVVVGPAGAALTAALCICCLGFFFDIKLLTNPPILFSPLVYCV